MHLVISRRSIAALFAPLLGTLGFLVRREDRLIAVAKRGDSDAFHSLQLLHGSALRQFIYHRVPEGDRDDLVQETWLAAWQGLPSFEDKGRFKAWLLTIAFRRIQDFHRREHVRPRYALDLEDQQLGYFQREYANIELQSELSDFWKSCTSEQRELLAMYYSEGLTLAEISRVTGRNLNTVKYQFYKTHSDGLRLLPNEAEEPIAKRATV